MRKFLKRIWRAIPQGRLKTKIHCTFYNREGFSFSYSAGVFEVRGPKGAHMLTNEAPFNLIKYYRWFLKHYTPKAGDTLVDAGAYNGHVSILFSKLVGPTGRVISFEPDPSNRALCSANMVLNKCENITLVDKVYGRKTRCWNFTAVTRLLLPFIIKRRMPIKFRLEYYRSIIFFNVTICPTAIT